jgi:hypothetical protein
MRPTIDQSLIYLEALLLLEEEEQAAEPLSLLITSLGPVQEAYVEVILQALRLLMQGEEAGSRELMQNQRNDLELPLARISKVVPVVSDLKAPLLKLVVEFLYTRSRLVDEVKMFPDYSLQLLERMSVDQSLEEVIHHLELVMTGKRDLYQTILEEFQDHR